MAQDGSLPVMNDHTYLKSLEKYLRDFRRAFLRLPSRVRTVLAVLAVLCIWLLIRETPPLEPERAKRADAEPTSVTARPPTGGDWRNIEQIFAFGDSWSYTIFDVAGDQPSEKNPFGNPGMPQNGVTHPPNYLHFLTTTYNESFIRTYIIAEGAATIDRDVVPPHENLAWTKPFKEQVNDKFAKYYNSESPLAEWDPRQTLFAIWFGVVDISLLIDRKIGDKDVNARNIASYESITERLYELGARQFLFLTIPPMYLSPSAREEGHDPTLEQELITDFNRRLSAMRKDLMGRHADATVFLFDAHGLLTKAIQTPEEVIGAEHLKNTTDNCFDYNPDIYGEPHPWDWYNEKCGIPFDEYFWANALHPTHAAHNATAAAIVSDCMGAARTGFCS